MFTLKPFHTISFKHAWDGLVHTFVNQPNLRIHLSISLLVLIAGALFRLSHLEWIILLFTIMWVLVSEMINTVVEEVCNLVSEEFHTSIKIAKDVAAGMVLVGAFGSIIVGLVIFIPYIHNLF